MSQNKHKSHGEVWCGTLPIGSLKVAWYGGVHPRGIGAGAVVEVQVIKNVKTVKETRHVTNQKELV